MTIRYEWGIDVTQLVLGSTAVGELAVYTDNGTTDGLAELTSGTLCHTDISSVMGSGEFTGLASALQTEIDTVVGSLVAYTGSTMSYRILTTGTPSFDFRDAATPNGVGSGSSAGRMLAAALGFNYEHPDATGGSASDPYNILLSGASEYSSNVRPYFVINPAIPGRSNMSDEYEEEGGVSEAVADDGTAYHVAKDGLAIYSDWVQMGETSADTFTATGAGTPVFKRDATAAVPWSYQHAWEHSRTLGAAPFLVVDSGTSESAVHRFRSDGSSLKPTRFGSQDFDLWNVPFRTRLLGRL